MVQIEGILQEILENQKKMLADISSQRKMIQSIDSRLIKIEQEPSTLAKETTIPTSLIRVLRGLAEEKEPVSAERAAEVVNLSRNLTSGYLNRLADMGYAAKEPNLDGKGSRFLFRVNYSSLPEKIRNLLKKYEK